MAVITVSRQLGSMGSYIALEVADRLGLRYLDREILDFVAQQAGVPVEEVEALEARAGRLSGVMRLLQARPKLPAVASASLREQESFDDRVGMLIDRGGLSREAAISRLATNGALEYAPPADYLELVTSAILETAVQGEAMIVGRGGQMILRRQPGVFHVQVIARFETCVFNIIQREGVKWREAANRVRLANEQRAGYMRRFYNVDWLDSSLFDLVINTDRVPGEVAADTIIQAALALHTQADAEA